jgi:hypothetical protein
LSNSNNPAVRARAAELGATWVRINGVLWHEVQPVEGGGYDWTQLAALDRDLAAAQALGLTPSVIIRGAPAWAAVVPASRCSAVRQDRWPAYAAFLEALAARYRYQVIYWELGNEPDVSPPPSDTNLPYGCWGDANDPYYGGGHYGSTLRVASAALRRGNPQAQIVFGGLLLDVPGVAHRAGNPERFLEGALLAGAADSFDVLAYHGYSFWQPNLVDPDVLEGVAWGPVGGNTIGKASYLRSVMAAYNVRKPLWMNEGGLLYYCEGCPPPGSDFLRSQAEHLVRTVSRSAGNGMQMYAWYTLDGPGWWDGGMLDAQQQPRPVFNAYKYMIATTSPYRNVTAVNYGPGIEAYRFNKGASVVDVLWRTSSGTSQVSVPLTSSPVARSIYGEENVSGTISSDGKMLLLNVGSTPIYIKRQP